MAGELYFSLLLFTPVVIAITAADLALGGLRDLQSSSPFRTADIVILVAYACLGVMLLVPLLLVGFPAMLIVLLVAYLALGTAQATAIAAGPEERWGGRWPARLVALLLAYLPMLGSSATAWGAAVGWSWGIGTGLIRFFAPLAAIAAPPLVLVAYPILRA